MTATSSFRHIFLSWTNPSDVDLKYIEVWRSDTNNRTLASKVAELGTDCFTDLIGTYGVTRYYWVRAVDFSINFSAWYPVSETGGISATTAYIGTTDINTFAVTASKIFTKIPILESDSWTDNSPSAGYVAWGAHILYYNGAAYSISASNTNLKYIYWLNGWTSYTESDTNPTLTDGDFIIATNISGAHDLAWNAIANQIIGSAYIQNLAVVNAKIDELAVDEGKIANLSVSTLKIAGNAVTVPSYQMIGGVIYGNGGWQKVAGPLYLNNSFSQAIPISILFSARQGFNLGAKTCGVKLYRNGSFFYDLGLTTAFNDWLVWSLNDVVPASSNYYYEVYWYAQDSTVLLKGRSITILGVKR